MADRLYFGTDATREWLEARRAQAQADKASGKRTTVIFAAGTRTERAVETSVSTALFQLEHDLCKRFPADYDASVLMPIKRSRPRYMC